MLWNIFFVQLRVTVELFQSLPNYADLLNIMSATCIKCQNSRYIHSSYVLNVWHLTFCLPPAVLGQTDMSSQSINELQFEEWYLWPASDVIQQVMSFDVKSKVDMKINKNNQCISCISYVPINQHSEHMTGDFINIINRYPGES